MNEFYSEIAQRKMIASGARHKKTCGCKKCHMPMDDMTPSEIRGLNGPVKVYQLGKPMCWAAFLDMPEDLQKKYIKTLYARFGVSNKRLADMFGIDLETVNRKTAELGVKRKSSMTNAQKDAWAKFEVQR